MAEKTYAVMNGAAPGANPVAGIATEWTAALAKSKGQSDEP